MLRYCQDFLWAESQGLAAKRIGAGRPIALLCKRLLTLINHGKDFPLQPYLTALRRGALQRDAFPRLEAALLYFSHRPGQAAPDNLIVIDLHWKRPAVLPGLE